MTLDTFESARLQAERLTPAHFADLRVMDQNAGFMAHLGGPRDEAGTAAYLKHNLAHWSAYGFGLWMLRERHALAVVGRCCVRHLTLDGIDEIEVGYGFLPEYWGRGLATEIALACVDITLNRLQHQTAVAITLQGNAGSQHVLTKAGLIYERMVQHVGLSHMLFRSPSRPGDDRRRAR